MYRIVTTTAIEEKILSRAAEKINLNGLVVEAGEFNMKSTNRTGEMPDDRREMMETLMREWSGEANEEEAGLENDVPDDDQINEMMACSELELELYQRMDVEREQQRVKQWQAIHGPYSIPPPRLMEANGYPPWITHELWMPTNAALVEPMMSTIVEGERKRKADYYEDIEGETIESVTGTEDADEPLTRKRKNVRYTDGMTDTQFEKFLANGGETPVKSKRAAEKKLRRGEFNSEDCASLLKIIKEINKIKRPDGSSLSELFKKKPDRSIFPDYYIIISTPISLKEITDKIKKFEYSSINDIDEDFNLMCENARTYNEEGSFVCVAAEEVRTEFINRSAMFRR